MKVKIGPYTNWIGPYQIAEKLLFWLNKYEDSRVHDFGTWLAEDKNGKDSYLCKFCTWIHNFKSRQEYVRIDKYDTWGMDSTLALIALPMLKQLHATKHGAPFIADEDVPEELKSTSAPAKENDYDTDDNHFKRWDWVLEQMIHSFECKVDDSWQEQYRSGVIDTLMVPVDSDGNEVPKEGAKLFQMRDGPNNTYKCDYEAMALHQLKISNGFRLFGKYYEALWD
jgi:hypothetical protein